ncbi:MAG: carbohydrate-binding protein [Clostridia bacterium]|nr:carbohydrate-binding protein [Clostridia bacterium]
MQRTGNLFGMNNEYMSNGVSISPAVPSAGETLKVVYDGLLSKNGANDIFVHVGFGNKWEGLNDYRMSQTSTGFEATVSVSNSDTLNICFKDSADNWDNNSGKNYSFDISR